MKKYALVLFACVCLVLLQEVLIRSASGGTLLSTLLSGGMHTSLVALVQGGLLWLCRFSVWFLVPLALVWMVGNGLLVVAARLKVHADPKTDRG